MRTLWILLLTLAGCATVAPRAAEPAPAAPATRPELPEVEAEAVVQFVAAQSNSIRACYEQQLEKNPDLRGKMVLLFTVTPLGKATDVGVESDTFPTKDVATCVTGLVRQWAFPFKSTAGQPIEYPLDFVPLPAS